MVSKKDSKPGFRKRSTKGAPRKRSSRGEKDFSRSKEKPFRKRRTSASPRRSFTQDKRRAGDKYRVGDKRRASSPRGKVKIHTGRAGRDTDSPRKGTKRYTDKTHTDKEYTDKVYKDKKYTDKKYADKTYAHQSKEREDTAQTHRPEEQENRFTEQDVRSASPPLFSQGQRSVRTTLLVLLVGALLGNAILMFTFFSGNAEFVSRMFDNTVSDNTADVSVGIEKEIDHGFVVQEREVVENTEGVDLTEFWKVWRILEKEYVPRPVKYKKTEDGDITRVPDGDPESVGITEKKLLHGAIRGLTLATEDVYTNFLPEENAQKFREEVLEGEVDGVIGAYIGFRDEALTIIKVFKNSPANRGKLRSNDIIREIEGVDSTTYTLDEATGNIRGKRGTPVVLKIYRPSTDKEFITTLVRDRVQIPSIETETRDGVFIIRLLTFSKQTPRAFRQALVDFVKEARNEKADRILLDLRGNSGGILSISVYVAGLFLPENSVVLYEYTGDEELKVYKTRRRAFRGAVPKMTVLVDRDTASAAEILATALKHYGIADIVGIQTTGKGSVQTVRTTGKGGSILKITTAHWLTPGKELINKDGIVPDIDFRKDFVELLKEEPDAIFEDYALMRAIQHLRSK